ncbi:hypothetical protein ACFLZP_04625 [Patescibacteria group bacterium]
MERRIRTIKSEELKQSFGTWLGMGYPVVSAFTEGLLQHWDDLFPLIAQTASLQGDFFIGPGNIMAATRLAYAKAREDDFSCFYGLTDEEAWWGVVQDVLSQEGAKRVFLENIWRPPMVVKPNRGIGLQYILSHHFGENPISAVDLGAGLHFALTFLNSERYLEADFPGRDKVSDSRRKVDVVRGIGVDIQPRDLDWARASLWPLTGRWRAVKELEELHEEAMKRGDQFPFLQADITDQPECLRMIRQVSNAQEVDVVSTFFVLHQLDEPGRQELQRLVINLLVEGGIWVIVGEELVTDRSIKSSAVMVSRKTNGSIQPAQEAFKLVGQQRIMKVGEYFGVS